MTSTVAASSCAVLLFDRPNEIRAEPCFLSALAVDGSAGSGSAGIFSSRIGAGGGPGAAPSAESSCRSIFRERAVRIEGGQTLLREVDLAHATFPGDDSEHVCAAEAEGEFVLCVLAWTGTGGRTRVLLGVGRACAWSPPSPATPAPSRLEQSSARSEPPRAKFRPTSGQACVLFFLKELFIAPRALVRLVQTTRGARNCVP